MSKIKLEHIDNLSAGKKSGNKIGSRAVGHHLYKYERGKYERAMKNKFLEITKKDRINLVNIWDKVCGVKGWDNLVLIKNTYDGTAQILKDGIPISTGSTKDLKQLIKKYV